jgi:predicted dehydrogenase
MKPLRLGVIGLGSVVREIYEHLYFSSEYSGLVDIAAVCDISADNVKSFGDRHGVPPNRRFTDYRDLIASVELDAVAVNTPDSAHAAPTLAALDAGLDVFLPKPLADRIEDAHAMIARAREKGRFIGVDFHKREDPRVKEARTRFRNGDYGRFQSAAWWMIDKLLVADPNHEPRFFAMADFAEKNTPVSFLTVHMADSFMYITGLKPVEVRATGYSHKLPSLRPTPVDGYDLVDTELLMENGGICRIVTGWALPNTAHALTVQAARIIGSEGMLDLGFDRSGYQEVVRDGIFERNPLFRTFEHDGTVSGYGMDCPGRIFRNIALFRAGDLPRERVEELSSPFALGFHTTVVCAAAHESLARGARVADGVVRGAPVEVRSMLEEKLGAEAASGML